MPLYDQMPLYDSTATNQSLIGEVSDNLGLGRTPSTTDQRRVCNYLNHIQKVLVRKHAWSCLERSDSSLLAIDGQLSYELPPQVHRIKEVRLIDDTCQVANDCELVWTSGDGSAAATLDQTYRKEGSASAKMTFQTDGIVVDGEIMGYIAFSSSDISEDYTSPLVGAWFYCDEPLAKGDLNLVLSNSATLGTADIEIALPALAAKEWTYLNASVDAAGTALDFTSDGDDLATFQSVGIVGTSSDAIVTTDSSNTTALYVDAINFYEGDYGGFNWPLKIITTGTFDRIVPNPYYISEDRPTVFVCSGGPDQASAGSFELYPIPDNEYPIWIRYTAKPTEFSLANADTLVKPCDIEDIDDVLIAGATWVGFCKERQWDDAGNWEGIFRRTLKEAILSDERKDGWRAVMGGGFSINHGELIDIPTNTQGGERGTTTGFFYV